MKAITSATGLLLVFIYAFGSAHWIATGGNWYQSLKAPSFQPPDFIFGLIWPYNFLTLAIASVSIANQLSTRLVVTYLALLAITVTAALVWSYLFYHPHNLMLATVALFIAALFTIPIVYIGFQVSTAIGIALIPYQLWLITAATLSYGYYRLN